MTQQEQSDKENLEELRRLEAIIRVTHPSQGRVLKYHDPETPYTPMTLEEAEALKDALDTAYSDLDDLMESFSEAKDRLKEAIDKLYPFVRVYEQRPDIQRNSQ